MKLTERLKKVAELVPMSSSMADIGTDHAYLPIVLLQEGKIKHALACDIHRGPLERAKAHILRNGYETYMETRLGGGLSPVRKGEVDGVVIAGMGGLMMMDILESDTEKAHTLEWMVLQPQNHVADLKCYLSTHQFRIVKEEMAREEDQLYEMMLVVPGSMHGVSLFEGEVGVTADYRKNPLFPFHVRKLINKRNLMIQGISADTDNEENIRKREKALLEKEELEALL